MAQNHAPFGAEAIVRSNNRLGVNLFGSLGDKVSNQLISPISLSSNLRLLLAGTRGETEKTLSRAMDLSGMSAKQVGVGSELLDQVLTGLNDSQISIANSLWIGPGLALKPTFASTAATAFHATAQPLKGSGFIGVQQINAWVRDHTKQRINELFRSLPRDAVLILANAVTFDGVWQTPFAATGTRPRVFHGSEGDTQTPTMSLTGMIESATSGGTEFVRLPYTGSTSMWIVLPKAGHDPGGVVDKFLSLPQTSASRAKLFLPKLKFEDEHDLQAPLTRLGLGSLFIRGDFSGISEDKRLGKISQIRQKTFIDVNEKGTEAAAATGIAVSPTAVIVQPSVPEIHIDRPFALASREDTTGTLLFVGVVRILREPQS